HGKDGVVILCARVVDIDRPARGLLLDLVVPGEIRTDSFPVHSAVSGFEQALATVVERIGIVRRNHDGGGPLKTVLEIRCTLAIADFRLHGYVLQLPGALVESGDFPLVVARVNDGRLRRIRRDIARFATADVVPVRAIDGAVVAAAGNRDGAVVLLGTVYVVRRAVVSDDVVELRGRLVQLVRPGFTAIQADGHAAIVGYDHSPGIPGIDPHAVIVAVRNFDLVERTAGVARLVEIHVRHVDGVRVLRIGNHVH